MHGRLKVRTSAELQAIQKKKDQEKAEVYRAKMQDILSKKKNAEYDDEIMSLTSEVIYMNPDVATVWNARKERLLDFKNKGIEIVQDQIELELKLTEAGLRINPKSYCAWYHRCWVLDNFAGKSEWARELQICTKYLELDDRNFHCWDYRRYVTERHGTPLEKELDYSLQKLESNFSNYSAWHYRSKLIPRVHKVFQREKLFENEIYQNEISLVENAVYTDPKDQSAWFYHRWLLGHIEKPSKFLQAGYNADSGLAWIVVDSVHHTIRVEGLNELPWEYLNQNKTCGILVKHVKEVPEDSSLSLMVDGVIVDTITLLQNKNVYNPARFKPVLNEKEEVSLREQLKSYEKLLELEPDNKWTLLAVLIIKEKLNEKIESSVLDKLELNDNYRKNYYSDLASRYKIESVLSTVEDWTDRLVMNNHNLTALYYSCYFTLFQEVDLSDNLFGNDVIKKLDVLLSCKVLNLSNCKITSIDAFPTLTTLRSLNISKNEIICDKLPPGLLSCRSLEVIDFTFVPVNSNVREMAAKMLPNLIIIN